MSLLSGKNLLALPVIQPVNDSAAMIRATSPAFLLIRPKTIFFQTEDLMAASFRVICIYLSDFFPGFCLTD